MLRFAVRTTTLSVAALIAVSLIPGCSFSPQVSQGQVLDANENVLHTASIDSVAGFERFGAEGGGFFQGGRSLKFLIDRRSGSNEIHFINGNYKVNGRIPEYAQFHYDFSRFALNVTESVETFNRVTYFSNEKRFVAGTVRSIATDSGTPRFLVMFFPQDAISSYTLLDTMKTVKAAFQIPEAQIAFVPTGAQQTLGPVESEMKNLGMEVTSIDEILGNTKFIPMHSGEAYGYLRIFPQDSDALEPTDIPVFDELPLDLTVVAGVMTRAFQDVNSHVNLKSKERGTPNMVLRDAGPAQATLAPFANKPIHLKVTANGFEILPSSDAEVQAKFQEKMNGRPWQSIAWEPETRLLSYDDMCPTDAKECLVLGKRYGSKASNLGFLAHRTVLGRTSHPGSLSARVGYDLTPKGFAVPLQFYKELVDAPENSALKAKIDTLVRKEKSGQMSKAERRLFVEEIQNLFLNARFPAQNKEKVLAQVASQFAGFKKIKVRSSASAEDIPNFDGAGLHDSFSAKLDKVDNPDESCRFEEDTEEGGAETKRKVKPATVACGIKGVYASLWNLRAIEERNFARIDPEGLAMGISLLPAYDSESPIAANSVVITRVVNDKDSYGYSLSVQKGNNLVTNPLPGTWSETSLANFVDPDSPMSFSVLRYAKPTAVEPTMVTRVLADAPMKTMVEVAQQVEISYCKAKNRSPFVDCRSIAFDTAKSYALDMEFKYLENGHFVCKQVREFAGR